MANLLSILAFVINDRLQDAAFRAGWELGTELRVFVDTISGHPPDWEDLTRMQRISIGSRERWEEITRRYREYPESLADFLAGENELVKLQFTECSDCSCMIAERVIQSDPTRREGIERIRDSAIVSCYLEEPVCAYCAQDQYSDDIEDWLDEQADQGLYPPSDSEIVRAGRRVADICLSL